MISFLSPIRTLQSRFSFFQIRKLGNRHWIIHSRSVHWLLWGLRSLYYNSHCQGLHRAPDADSKGFPSMWPFSWVAVKGSCLKSVSQSTQTRLMLGTDGTRSELFLRYETRQTQWVLLPISCLYSPVGMCQDLPRMTQERSPWVIPYPSRLLQNNSSVLRQADPWKAANIFS